jgi:hypothetical protein
MSIVNCIRLIACSLVILNFINCSSSSNKDFVGKYAYEGYNEFDYFKDTLEVRPNDDGKFDIQIIANWSAAKKDDPERPVNKKAGQWNSHGAGNINIATLQKSNMTIRITEPFSSEVRMWKIDHDNKTIEMTTRKASNWFIAKS